LGPAPLSAFRSEPIVRVRILESVPSVRIDAPSTAAATLTVAPLAGPARAAAPDAALAQSLAAPLTITRDAVGFILRPAQGQPLRWNAPALFVSPPQATTSTSTSTSGGGGGGGGGGGNVLRVNGKPFPGSLAIHIATDDDGRAFSSSLDVVEHVGVETYLPGVLEKELYGSWHPEAFRAQAVAARSYALDRIHRFAPRAYDLNADTRSQAYVGLATAAKPINAVRDTRGLVLAYRNHLVTAYYSAACGGAGQDAAIAFDGETAIPPLASQTHGPCCAASNRFRWGPITRDRSTLSQRLLAWALAQKPVHPLAALLRDSAGRAQPLGNIAVTARSASGRPARFTLVNLRGQTLDLNVEQFRFACNFEGAGLPPLAPADKLPSSHCDITITPAAVVFAHGQGFGHGVGLCQWGAQNLAQRGQPHPQILQFYYPDATLARLY
jgi:stage II sporulation protein D